MDNILVIGAAGQIGSELVVELRKNYGSANVFATDIKQPPRDVIEGGPFRQTNNVIPVPEGPGLGVTLDPSHYLCNSSGPKEYDRLLKYVYHVHLRDSTKTNLQVRIGQGEIEYGRLINMLNKVRYDRSFSVDIREMEGVEHIAELRKMRLLLESLM